MNKFQLAEMLNGRTYRAEMSIEEAATAKANGILVLYGQSDDLLEMQGIIDDEVDAWEGVSVFLFKDKKNEITFIAEDGKQEIDEVFETADIENPINFVEIKASWSPSEPECSWLIKTEIPNASFNIFEDGELYCRGIVLEKQEILDYLGK